MIAINLLRSLPPVPQSLLWKEGTPMSGNKATRPLFSDSVTKDISPDFSQATRATVAPATTDSSTVSPRPSGPDSFLPLEWALTPKGISLAELERIRREESIEFLSERVMARLQLAEAKSGDHDHKLAYRLAWHIVLHCMKGDAVECSPVTLAYYAVVGCHEEQYYGRVMIRRAAMFGDANRLTFPKPSLKKQVQSTPEKKERTA
jgi:hypothetical protein